MKQIKLPACIAKHPQLIDAMFNSEDKSHHLTQQNTSYDILLISKLMAKHYEQLARIFGSGTYKNGLSINSGAINDNNLNQSWILLMKNYKENTQALSLLEEQDLIHTIDTLSDNTPHYHPPHLFGISSFIREASDAGYVIFVLSLMLLFFVFDIFRFCRFAYILVPFL